MRPRVWPMRCSSSLSVSIHSHYAYDVYDTGAAARVSSSRVGVSEHVPTSSSLSLSLANFSRGFYCRRTRRMRSYSRHSHIHLRGGSASGMKHFTRVRGLACGSLVCAFARCCEVFFFTLHRGRGFKFISSYKVFRALSASYLTGFKRYARSCGPPDSDSSQGNL